MTAEATRIGIVGIGPMGALHSVIGNALPRSKIVGICDSNERLLRMGRSVLRHVGLYSSVTDMIEDSHPNAIFICTPATSHAEITKEIAEVGGLGGIFIEKPMGTSEADATKIAGLVKGRVPVTMVGYQKRFNGAFQEMRRLLNSGLIGSPLLVRAHQFTPGGMGSGKGWRFDPRAGGAVLEWGVHVLDLILWVFGVPDKLTAVRKSFGSEYVEDYARAELGWETGLLGSVEIGWSMRNYLPPELKIEVHGSTGVLSANEDRLLIYTDTLTRGSTAATPKAVHSSQLVPAVDFLVGPYETVLQDTTFLESVAEGTPASPSFTDAIRVHALTDIIRSARLEKGSGG